MDTRWFKKQTAEISVNPTAHKLIMNLVLLGEQALVCPARVHANALINYYWNSLPNIYK